MLMPPLLVLMPLPLSMLLSTLPLMVLMMLIRHW
jgi:hypothetical protein